MDDVVNYDRILMNIAACQDVDKLMTFAANAKKRNVKMIEDAALKKLNSLIPSYKNGSYEKAFWEMILGYQSILYTHGKPTLRLNQAMKSALNDGEIKAHSDWIENKRQIWALDYLMMNSPKTVTAEKLVLMFSDLFEENVKILAEENIKLAIARTLEKK